MSFVALDRLVRGGHVPEAEAPRVAELWDEIRRLKRDKRAFIPAHNYQVPEVQAIADVVGDSFELAVKARDLGPEQAALVVFCGVRFMAEGCYTLAPERPVYLPSLEALCSLAEVDAADVAARQEFLR
ncbi:MAG TPA: quinolinate synthase NadA, partial [Polyangia bacterium]